MLRFVGVSTLITFVAEKYSSHVLLELRAGLYINFSHVHTFVTCTFFISPDLFNSLFVPRRVVFIIVVCVVYFPYYKPRTAVYSLRTNNSFRRGKEISTVYLAEALPF